MQRLGLTLWEMIEKIHDKDKDFLSFLSIFQYKSLEDFLEKAEPYELSRIAYWWAINIGDREVMIDYVTHEHWVLQWALNIGNHDIMFKRITSPEYVFMWSVKIGNQDVAKDKIKRPFWVKRWNSRYPDDKIDDDKDKDK